MFKKKFDSLISWVNTDLAISSPVWTTGKDANEAFQKSLALHLMHSRFLRLSFSPLIQMKTIRLLTNATYTSDQCLSTFKVWTNHLGESSESADSDSVELGWGRGATFPSNSQVKPILLIGKNLTLLNSITLYNYPTKRGLHRLSISVKKNLFHFGLVQSLFQPRTQD